MGPVLARRLGVPHLDVDLELERRQGRTIRQIFDTEGEHVFRALERDLTVELLQRPGVLSLGGGAPMTPVVAAALANHPVVWLRVEPESAAQRIGRDENRPLLAGPHAAARLRQMLVERGPTYGAVASLAVDTDLADPDAVVEAIAAHVAEVTAGRFNGEVIPVTAEKPYQVRVGSGVSAQLPEALGRRERVALIHPHSLASQAQRSSERVDAEVTLLAVPDGVDAKDVAVLGQIWGTLARQGFTRHDAVVGFGGGSTTDLSGFVAATWMRGIDHVAVPSTLEGMVDAAVGGKTSINLPGGQNQVGAFWEPSAVLCDVDLLATLPADDLRAGMAEMVKHGLVADPRTLRLFEEDAEAMFDPTSPELGEAIARSIRIKTAIASVDLRETPGEGTRVGRELLNYGHTLGNAIEQHAAGALNHGFAVSIGMMFAAHVSEQLGFAPASFVARHRLLLERLGLPTGYGLDAWPVLRALMNHDKKARGSALRLVLLDDVAQPRIVEAPPEDVLTAAYRALADHPNGA